MKLESVGHYRVLNKVGAGGMGEVYRAYDTNLSGMSRSRFDPSQLRAHLTRLEREARLLAALQHPNIATIHGVEEGAIVMEFVEGGET
jgi:serine/threonine protein kinase